MVIQDLPPKFEQLLNQLLNSQEGEFSTSEFEQFQSILSTDPQAMQRYFEYIDINSGIQTHMSERLQALEETAIEETAQEPQFYQEPQVIKDVPSRRRAPYLNYFFVAAASLMMFLTLEWIVSGDFLWNQTSDSITKKNLTDLPYVATLTRSTDCVWGGESPPEFSGQRLLTNELILEQGVAEFRFDSGVRLIIEGPTKINMVSACCAKLAYGKTVLHGYEASPEFALITPLLTFHDIGTEYGARIDKDGEVDLHVFEGAVRVDPNQKNEQFAESVIINAGQARHLKETAVDKIQLQPELFNREVPGAPKNLQALQQELRVYDSFHPSAISDPERLSEWQNAGIGWENPWRKQIHSRELAKGDSHPRKSLARTELTENQLGLIELRKGKRVWRTLEKPILMDTNAIYYLSFYMQKIDSGPDVSGEQFGNLSLQTSVVLEHPRKILFGMSSESFATLQAGMQIVETAPPLQTGETYFFVAKIVASEKAADQVFLRTFSEAETIPDREPPVWTCVTTPFQDSNQFDLVRIHVARQGDFLFDELRIGTTWGSVINPDLPRLILEKK
ncbi:hypothetical protein [uncultured Gimesia sp.]|uniref:hypothetical protein n=1 Tax=uncultured Gimesia sp. TaxID=1678688 RepID=UPI0030D80953|tara:strand:- start:24778 stop:26466 length:1689 start_codon:yes stop_codon:yes gene_type:complete